MGASSAYAVEAALRPSSEQGALVETLPAPAPAEVIIVEGTGPYGANAQSVNRHLAASLKTDAGLFPRSEARTFFDGDVKMNYQVGRAAIDRPFGNERAIMELPKVCPAVAISRLLDTAAQASVNAEEREHRSRQRSDREDAKSHTVRPSRTEFHRLSRCCSSKGRGTS
jgi:hypothetical protein